MTVAAVLFDLDGTLVDTAPDLVMVLNTLLVEFERPPMPYAIARNEVSNGAIGLLRLGFGRDLSDAEFESLRQRFLELYTKKVCVYSRLFIDIYALFNKLDHFSECWGIVTNKPQAMTDPLLAELGIAELPASVVSGDRLQERKPHPAPLQLAASEVGFAPEQCVYIGDALRDIQAGKAAGMKTVAATYGYIRPGEDPRSWGANTVLRHPSELAATLELLDEMPS